MKRIKIRFNPKTISKKEELKEKQVSPKKNSIDFYQDVVEEIDAFLKEREQKYIAKDDKTDSVVEQQSDDFVEESDIEIREPLHKKNWGRRKK